MAAIIISNYTRSWHKGFFGYIINLKWVFLIIIFFLCQAGVRIKVHEKLMTNSGHTDMIKSVCFTPSGNYILSGSNDNTMKLWDVNTGKLIRDFIGHTASINSVSVSSNGLYVISSSSDNTIKIWNILNGQQINELTGHKASINSICYSPDGKNILSGSSDKSIKLWNAESGKVIKTFYGHSGGIKSVCFSHNGEYILSSSSDKTVKLWDVSSGDEIKTFNFQTRWVNGVTFLNNSKKIIVKIDKLLKTFDIESGKEINSFEGHSGRIFAMRLSSNSMYALTGSYDKTIKLWDVGSGKVLKTFKGHNGSITDVRFSPDEKYILSGSTDCSIKLWSIEKGKEIKTFGKYFDKIRAFFFDNKNKAIFFSNGNLIKRLDLGTGEISHIYKGHNTEITTICLSEDGKQLLSGASYGDIILWDKNTQKIINKKNIDYNSMKESNGINTLSINPKGNFTLVGDTRVKPFMLAIPSLNEIKSFDSHSHGVNAVTFNSTGKIAITCSNDHLIKIWDSENEELLHTLKGHNHIVLDADISPNDKFIVSGSYDKTIKIWDVNTGKEIKNLVGHKSAVSTVCFSNDNKWILSGSDDNTLKLWNISTGEIIQEYIGHSDRICSACFNMDDNKIFSSSFDGTMKIWDVITGKLILTIYPFGDTDDYVIITPDGRFDGTPEGLKLLHYVKGMEIIPLESTFEKFYTPNLLARVMAGEKFEPINISINTLKLPPLVEIVTPENNLESRSKQIQVKVNVTDQGGGIDEIRLFHNGKLFETTQRGFKAVSKENIQEFTISLVHGMNTIKATAFNNERTEAIPDIIEINYSGEKATSKLHLLAVGINNYKNPRNKLNYATADANSFKAIMEEGSKSIFAKYNSTFLKDNEATKATIINSFNNIVREAKQEDVFVFYYAGHGVMSEEEESKFYVVPHDVIQLYGDNEELRELGISAEELQELATKIKAQKQLYILDACQSGGMVDLLASRGAAEQKAIAQLARSTGTYWLAASNTQQFATEFAELGHGLFTYSLLEGLGGKADSGAMDKRITVEELISYVKNVLPELSEKYKGEPQYPNSYQYGNDFPLVLIKQ